MDATLWQMWLVLEVSHVALNFHFFLGMAVSRPKCNNKLSSVLGGWQ